MNPISLLTGAGLGAGLMYLLDPDRGNRRRSLLRDQMRHAVAKTGRGTDATLRDIENRLYGTMAEMRGYLKSPEASDAVLVSRVRSKMGRYVTHPSAIEVAAHDGVVTLGGPILAHEVDDLLCAVKAVRGVRDIEDRLDVHESPGNISALQGAGQRWGEPPPLMQTYWSPATRLAVGSLGGALMLNCLARRTPAAMLAGTAGFAMFLRALTNLESKRLFGFGGRRGIDVQKTIVIDKPVEEVFGFLAEPGNYPHISDTISSAKDLGDGRCQKTICGPGGAELTVTEKITRYEPNQFLAVRSEPDSPLQYAARAWFLPLGDASTKVHIQATYNPPGGVLAHSAAWLAGVDLKSRLDDVLMRAKQYLETGIEPHDAAQPTGDGRRAAQRKAPQAAGTRESE